MVSLNDFAAASAENQINNGVILQIWQHSYGQLSCSKSFYIAFSGFCFTSPFSTEDGIFGSWSLVEVPAAVTIWEVLGGGGMADFGMPLLNGSC